MKIAINGLGRIGRLVLRRALETDGIEVSLLNSPSEERIVSHLIKYDSTHGVIDDEVTYGDGYIKIGSRKIVYTRTKNLNEIECEKHNIDILIECSGKFAKTDNRENFLATRAKKILLSAPSDYVDKTIIMGVNDKDLNGNEQIISIGSCTTNALAPIAKIINDNFGIEEGYVTTIHSYTSDQNLLDNSHDDLRRARSAAESMIPTKTGAAKAISKVLPELKGRIDGSAIRVPVSNVSLIDFVCNINQKVTEENLNQIISSEIEKNYNNILASAKAPLVSSDYNHSTYSSIFDPYETKILNDRLIRILCWYDNEWGFVCRMIDICKKLIQNIR